MVQLKRSRVHSAHPQPSLGFMRDTWKARDRGDRNLKLYTSPRPQWCMPPPEDLEVGDVDSDGGVCVCAHTCVRARACVYLHI